MFSDHLITMYQVILINFSSGSNTHNNQPPAGDGQAGDAGEGKGGTSCKIL